MFQLPRSEVGSLIKTTLNVGKANGHSALYMNGGALYDDKKMGDSMVFHDLDLGFRFSKDREKRAEQVRNHEVGNIKEGLDKAFKALENYKDSILSYRAIKLPNNFDLFLYELARKKDEPAILQIAVKPPPLHSMEPAHTLAACTSICFNDVEKSEHDIAARLKNLPISYHRVYQDGVIKFSNLFHKNPTNDPLLLAYRVSLEAAKTNYSLSNEVLETVRHMSKSLAADLPANQIKYLTSNISRLKQCLFPDKGLEVFSSCLPTIESTIKSVASKI